MWLVHVHCALCKHEIHSIYTVEKVYSWGGNMYLSLFPGMGACVGSICNKLENQLHRNSECLHKNNWNAPLAPPRVRSCKTLRSPRIDSVSLYVSWSDGYETPIFRTYVGWRNRLIGIASGDDIFKLLRGPASLCSLVGRYDNPLFLLCP